LAYFSHETDYKSKYSPQDELEEAQTHFTEHKASSTMVMENIYPLEACLGLKLRADSGMLAIECSGRMKYKSMILS
jgi:hypothetical protein